jgi:hypothetical protein
MHLTEPERRIVGYQIECQPLKFLHKEVDHRRQWQTHSHALGLFVDLAEETDEGRRQKKKTLSKLNIFFLKYSLISFSIQQEIRGYAVA